MAMKVSVPQYQPNQIGGVQPVQERFVASTFNSGVGEAVAGLGGAIRDYGEYQNQLEAENDKIQVHKAVANVGIELTELDAEYKTLALGKAVESQEGYRKRVQSRAEAHLESMGSERQRRLFSEAMIPLSARIESSIATHAIGEQKKEAVTAVETRITATQQMIAATDNPIERDMMIAEARPIVLEKLELSGIVIDDSEESQLAQQAAILDFTDPAHAAFFAKKLVNPYPDFDEIKGFLEAYSDEMKPETVARVMQQLKPALENRLNDSDMDATLLYMDDAPAEGGDVPAGGGAESGENAGASGGAQKPARNKVVAAPNPVGPPDVVNYFSSRLPAHVAAGVVGGIMSESSGNDRAYNGAGGGQGAHGLGQHRGSRLAAMRAKYGPNPTRQQQMEFLLYELKGGDAGGKKVLESKTAAEAAANYIRYFMRPSAADMDGGIKRAVAAATGGKGEYDAQASGVSYQADGSQYDRDRVMKAIDRQAEENNWTLERKQAAIQGWDRRIAQNEAIKGRQEEAAREQLEETLYTLGPDGFVSMSQLPADVLEKAPPSYRLQLQRLAAANKAAAEAPRTVPANGDRALALERRLLQGELHGGERRADALKLPIENYRNELTPEEYSSLIQRRDKLGAKLTGADYASGVVSQMPVWKKLFHNSEEFNDLETMRVQTLMIDYMQTYVKTGQPTAANYREAYLWATREAKFKGNVTDREITRRAYQDQSEDLNINNRRAMARQLKAAGYPITEDNIHAMWNNDRAALKK